MIGARKCRKSAHRTDCRAACTTPLGLLDFFFTWATERPRHENPEDAAVSELAFSSAVAIAKKIRRREISSREAVDYFLARVEALDKPINSVVTIDAERARAEAGAADAAIAHGEVRGLLHGVPMTIKDSFQTAGMRTTWVRPELAEFIPHEDAWPVARLRAGEPSSSERPTCRSTPAICKATTKSSVRRTTLTIRRALRAAHRAGRPQPWPADSLPWNWAAILAARYDCRRICRGWPATSRVTGLCPPTGRSPALRGR